MATSGATLDSIYNRLSSAPEYHPFSADTFSDWSMEAGDIIRVSRDGKHYDSPVHTSQMTWRGQSQISVSSDGNEKRESIAKATKRKYGRGGSGYRNDNHLWQELLDDYNGLYSFFEVTSSRMFVTFSGMYDGLSSDFEVTRSRMAADFQGKYDGLASSFEVTRSRMAADFQGKYDGLSSSFEVTRSRMAADFQGKYDGLSSSFEVTRSRMYVDFQGMYDGLSSEFEVTRSRFHVELVDSYNQLSSGIEAAANYAMMYAESRTSRAEIIARINDRTGQSEALVNAENIIIGEYGGAKISLNDKITVDQSGNLYISGNIAMDLTGSNYLQTKEIRLIGASSSQGAKQSILTDNNIHDMIAKASIEENTLKLWKLSEIDNEKPSLSFSKATSLSGSWGSGEEGGEPLGKFTVTATQNGAEVGSVFTNITYAPGQVTWSSTQATIPLYATIGTSQQTHFVRNVQIAAPTIGAPTFSLTGTNAGNTNTAYATSSNGRAGSSVYLYLVVGDIDTKTQKIPVTLKSSTVSAADARDNGTRVGYAEVRAPYNITDWTFTPLKVNETPSGYTYVDGKYYYRETGKSGYYVGIRLCLSGRMTVDGNVLNYSGNTYQNYTNYDSVPTHIWHDAFQEAADIVNYSTTENTSTHNNYEIKVPDTRYGNSTRTIYLRTEYVSADNSVYLNVWAEKSGTWQWVHVDKVGVSAPATTKYAKISPSTYGSWYAAMEASVVDTSSTSRYYFGLMWDSGFSNHKLNLYIKYSDTLGTLSDGGGTTIATRELNCENEWASGWISGWNDYHNCIWYAANGGQMANGRTKPDSNSDVGFWFPQRVNVDSSKTMYKNYEANAPTKVNGYWTAQTYWNWTYATNIYKNMVKDRDDWQNACTTARTALAAYETAYNTLLNNYNNYLGNNPYYIACKSAVPSGGGTSGNYTYTFQLTTKSGAFSVGSTYVIGNNPQ